MMVKGLMQVNRLHEKNFIKVKNKERYEYGTFGYLRSTCLEIDKCSRQRCLEKDLIQFWTNSHKYKYIAIAILKAKYMLKCLTAARYAGVNCPNFTAAISTVREQYDRKPVL